MNKKIILLGCFSLLLNAAFAQFGLTGGYHFNDPSEWVFEDGLAGGGPDLIGDGPSLGIDYWFRLKSYRVEFLPELNYARFTASPVANLETETDVYSFFFNTHFYLFDFEGDCDCPTFSKQGNTLEKGFFLRLSPGISWFRQRYDQEGERQESSHWAASLGAGGGFDIGVSDLFTITPLVEVRYFPSVEWSGLTALNDPLSGRKVGGEDGSILQLMAGLRLGFRLDYE